MALRLLKEGNHSLRDIAQVKNVPKPNLCWISELLRDIRNLGWKDHEPLESHVRRTDYIEVHIANCRSSATENVSGIRSVRMRQLGEDTADDILNLTRNVKNASRMVQRVINVIKKEMTVKNIRSARVPVRKRTLLPSKAPAEHRTVGEMLPERRKLMNKNYAMKTKRSKRAQEDRQGIDQIFADNKVLGW